MLARSSTRPAAPLSVWISKTVGNTMSCTSNTPLT
jgi:hypothetical protein